MKSTKIAALALALALAVKSQALVDISAFGGYATVGMADVNDLISKAALPNGTSTAMSSGYYVGAQAGFTTFPFLKIGPRIEYLQSGQGKVTYVSGNTSTVDAGLMSYELGAALDTSLPLTGLSVAGGVWAGYGMASTKITNSSQTGSSTGTGSGLVVNLGAQLRYKLVAGLFLGVDLGYRMANISNVNDDKTDSNVGTVAGQPFLKKANGDQANFDYSGMNAGGTIGFNF